MKTLTIVGARPQFIKAAVTAHEFAETKNVQEVLVHTGQHYDANMSEVFFEELGIPVPSHQLNVGSGLHGAQTGKMLEGIEKIALEEKPDWILVYGDTNSTLAGALVGAKLHIPVAHVEAGLRSFNKKMPEEINRIVADHVSEICFVPTKVGQDNLRREGIAEDKIVVVGDVMYDAARVYGAKAEGKSRILARFELKSHSYILATVHRAENTDEPQRLRALFEGLNEVSKDLTVIVPLHPRTKKMLDQVNWKPSSNLRIIEPVGYLDMIMLEKNAALIATDSGGVQKEAFFYQTPCVTLRSETEWVELVELGWNKVVAPVSSDVVANAIKSSIGTKGRKGQPYGDGHAAAKIVQTLLQRTS